MTGPLWFIPLWVLLQGEPVVTPEAQCPTFAPYACDAIYMEWEGTLECETDEECARLNPEGPSY